MHEDAFEAEDYSLRAQHGAFSQHSAMRSPRLNKRHQMFPLPTAGGLLGTFMTRVDGASLRGGGTLCLQDDTGLSQWNFWSCLE